MLPEGIGAATASFLFRPDGVLSRPYYKEKHLSINTLTQHIMNYFYKALILAVDIMMAVTLGLEIRDRISARKKNKDTEVADPEPVTTD